MGKLTTHILDTTLGTPAEMVNINLYRRVGSNSEHIMSTQTNKDGRCDEPLLSEDNFQEGCYEIEFSIDSLSLIYISEPTRPERISYDVFCLIKKKHLIYISFMFFPSYL